MRFSAALVCGFVVLTVACGRSERERKERGSGSGGDSGGSGGNATGGKSGGTSEGGTPATGGQAGTGAAGTTGQGGSPDGGESGEASGGDGMTGGAGASNGGAGGAAGSGGNAGAGGGFPPVCETFVDCASGSCIGGECERCVEDSECKAGRVCATGVCSTPCAGEGAACGDGRTCCSDRCVDTSRDINHCGACSASSAPAACDEDEFCGTEGCAAAVIANLCRNARVACLAGGDMTRVQAGCLVAAAFSACAPPLSQRTIPEGAIDGVNRGTGRPVAGPGELLVPGGGPDNQPLPRFLEGERIAALVHVLGGTHHEIRRTADDSVVASALVGAVGQTHDFLVFEVVRDPMTGTLVFLVNGFSQNGTFAASWYFENAMMPALATFTKSWYVYEFEVESPSVAFTLEDFTLIAEAP